MLRVIRLTVVLLFPLMLLSCSVENDNPDLREGRQVTDKQDDNFHIILYSNKDIYHFDEEVVIWATIEYVGPENNITIYSGEPIGGFYVVSDGVSYISYSYYPMLKTTVLSKGDILEIPMEKSGGFSETDEDADYWREFYNEERMLFPIGEYNVVFSTNFYTDTDPDIDLEVEYQFIVE